MTSRPLSHWLLLFALVAMWGSSFMLTRLAVTALAPSALVTLRMVVAAATLSTLLALGRRSLPGHARFWLFSVAIAVIGNCLPFWLISFGQQRIDSGLAGILMAIMPLTTMVLAHFFVAGEQMNGVKAAGFALGFAGIVVLVGPEALLELRGQGTELLYQLAALGGALCYAVHTIVARHRPPCDPLVAAAAVMLVGSLIMLPIGGPVVPSQLAEAPPVPLLAALALGLISTATAMVVFLRLVVVAGPSFTSFINYLIPLWALLLGMLFLDEQPRGTALIALILILGGIALSEAGGRRVAAGPATRSGT
ncbi:MAG: DMT family transporter [Geminicoccaceae bacterium]